MTERGRGASSGPSLSGGTTRDNDVYAWSGHYNIDRPYTVNGLNQLTAAGATSLSYDGRGNLTNSGGSGYGYTAENRMAAAPATTMVYEPGGGQLLQFYSSGSGTAIDSRFGWWGGQMIAEIDGSTGAFIRRFVPGPGIDEPIVWYEASGTAHRRWLHADERGSVVAVSNASGAAIAINRYDEYGIPAATNLGRFQYTGQAWLPELGMYSYKNRMYSATLGRFMQTDPIGYGDGMNMYGYTGGDPVNRRDPTGTEGTDGEEIIVTAKLSDFSRESGPTSGAYVMSFTGISTAARYDFGSLLSGPEPLASDEGNDPANLTPSVVPIADEHTKNARPSTTEKHEKGRARVNKDRGGEKGDARRRFPRIRPKGHKGPWPPNIFPPLLIPDIMLTPCVPGSPISSDGCGPLIV